MDSGFDGNQEESSSYQENVLPHCKTSAAKDIKDTACCTTEIHSTSDELQSAKNDWITTTKQDSKDLDEKFTSMTGSYSEIMDESRGKVTKTPEFLGQESCGTEEESEEMRLKHQFHKDSIARFMKDFTDKSSISSQSSKDREGHSKSHKSSISNAPSTSTYPTCPPVDPSLIGDLEEHARKLAVSMDTLIEGLTGTLHSISALSVDCMETYRDAVCKTCDTLDSNIKSMYQLMAKCEELNKSMKSVYKLHDQIKEIRRLLDMYENVVLSGGP